ncbi:DUF4876 domain-containing protein [Myroides odoratimimus]|uniref:DUF4876 domain-containing protein n=1 Tax=Myroides odoratimimus TaxID=76832 RepID=UPI0025773229|nr:DUF4876 domain-containing protein [Myroides odoratimimus]MDM1398216.1 DUF4876 domain-containing protein [Myroides odoratimimus]
MKNRVLALFVAILGLGITTVSCSSDDNSIDNVEKVELGNLSINFKTDRINGFKSYEKLTVKLTELNTGKETTQELASTPDKSITINKGSYQISVDGIALLESGDKVSVAANSEVKLVNPEDKVELDLIVKTFAEDFIIEEVFFSGVKSKEGKAYNSGKYFKITNNTDKVLSTGGLLILRSSFNSAIKHNNYTPEIRDEAMPVGGVVYIPHELGKDVQPGDFIVVADMAMNHKLEVDTAFDLSGADYEYPNTDNPKLGQVDNPAVPNAVVIYSYMNFNMFFLHNRGYEGYAIARFPEGVTVKSWLTDYKYDYTFVFPQNGKVAERFEYKIPNSWIIDGVNSGMKAAWEHNPIGPSVDSGWTGVALSDSDPTYFGKSIRRKEIGKMQNGKPLFKDTNNSTEDFVQWGEQASLTHGIVH